MHGFCLKYTVTVVGDLQFPSVYCTKFILILYPQMLKWYDSSSIRDSMIKWHGKLAHSMQEWKTAELPKENFWFQRTLVALPWELSNHFGIYLSFSLMRHISSPCGIIIPMIWYHFHDRFQLFMWKESKIVGISRLPVRNSAQENLQQWIR